MEKLIKYFIRNSFLVNLISVFLMIVGLISLFSMKRDLIPQWQSNQISITASLIGASPEQMEEFVTYPIEEAISNFAGIEEITSNSYNSGTNITVKIKDGYDEVQDLFENIDSAVNSISTDLPSDVEDINVSNKKMTYFWFSSASVLGFDEKNDQHRLWMKRLVDQIRKIPGIVKVDEYSSKPQLYMKLDRKKISRYQIELSTIQRRIKEKFQILPLGMLNRGEKDISVEIDNNISSLDDLNNLIVKSNASGKFIRLKDIAEVSYRFSKDNYRSFTNGKIAETIVLFKDLDTDTIKTKERFSKLLKEVNAKAPNGVEVLVTGDGPAYIERQLNVLTTNGIMGVFLVIFSLFIFLGFKSAIMTTLGLPLAYFTTFTVLSGLGINIDLMSVVGMILIIGIIVDDAIIVSEQYTQFLEMGYEPNDAALNAVKKTIGPITGTVITTIVAFLPILASSDGLSHILRAIPWVVIAALGMSWLESFFILPNHLAHFAKKSTSTKLSNIDKLRKIYAKTLKFCLRFRYALIGFMIAFMGFSIWFSINHVPMKYDLRIGSEKIRILAALKKSDSLDESEKKLKPIFDLIKKIDPSRYSYVNQNIGSAYINGKNYQDYRYANFAIRFSQTHPNLEEDKAFIEELVKKELEKVNRDDFEILKVDKKMDGHDDSKEKLLNLKVVGKSNVKINQLMKDTEENLKGLKGFEKVFIDPQTSVAKWNFIYDREAIHNYGVSILDIASQVRGYVTKENIHEFRYKGETIKVYAYFEEDELLSFDELQNIPIIINQGMNVPLKKFGTWKKEETLKSIAHDNLERVVNIDVTFDDKVVKKEIFQKEAEKQVLKLSSIYPELSFKIEDADKDAQKNKESLSSMVLIAVLLIIFVLAVVLNSVVQPFLIATAIPFGLIGVIWAFYFHGQNIDVMAIIGIIGMAGVVVNDSLIMVDTINKMRFNWPSLTQDKIIDGAVSRLRPILLTSITTLGGVFPMAYGIGGDSGFTKPLALSLGWGLLFATVLTLFLIPSMISIQKDIIMLFFKIFPKFKPAYEHAAIFEEHVENRSDYIESTQSQDSL